MDSGFYAACTALMARSETLDLVANNLANVSTPGYRARHDSFRSVLATSAGTALSGLNQAVNDYSVQGGGQLDLSQGNLEKTGNDLDLGIQGSGFFAIKTANGQLYTRDGNFHVSAKGELVTSEGDLVLGGDNRPIPIVGAPVSVSADGTISVNGALAGQVKMVDFPAGTPLESVGKNYYSAPDKSAVPATQASIQQGMLESSNVNAVASSIELITVQRYAELMQRALTMFHTEMNQVATQDLPRVPNNS
ncbi:MAG: flagellar basal-body rod protein FlgF [Terriglobales bacterium]|jgi:flagellar basal-body rod protein FlgF/flagellar basal-body rod protein FlgG